jgi:multidrug efflux pump
MISHFFIDRPIFATVLSIVITLTGALGLMVLPIAQYPQITPPSVAVAISYPGASAQVVADTVGAPIEQQVNGVTGMLYMSSQSGNDGSYNLSVTFDVGTDLNTALVMVQNRVALAMPQLPTEVQLQGITIKKKTPDILLVVNFISPHGRYDDIYLSNYALISVRDELFRLEGVSDINIFGERDYSIRVWLDPQKMAGRGITAGDVAAAIQEQSIESAAGVIGSAPAPSRQMFELPLNTLGRLNDPEQFREIIVKATVDVPRNRGGTVASVQSGAALTRGMNNPLGATTSSIGTTSPGSTSPGSPTTSTSGPTTSSSSTSTTSSTSSSTSMSSASSFTSLYASMSGRSASSAASTGTSGMSSGTTSSSSTTSTSIVTPVTPAQNNTRAITMATGTNTTTANVSGPPGQSVGVVRLRHLAHIDMGALNYNQAATFDQQPTVGLAVHMLPDSNALDVANRVRKKMEELKERFPDDVDYRIAYDITPFIRESIDDVVRTLLEAVAIVAIVVLAFLQSWRAALIPLIAVPVAIIGTFGAMAAVGFSLNNISLFGLVLAIGIVVDDAIVVVENVERWLERGLSPRDAARKAMEEVTGPVVAVALVLCAVFVPCAFLGGITGRFFRQFAVTIAVSTVFSAINSLTLSPALAAILLKKKGVRRDPMNWFLDVSLGWFFRLFNAGFNAATSGYAWVVGLLLRLSVITLLIYGGLLVLTYWVFARAPTGFIPDQDQGRLIVSVQLPDSAALWRTQKAVAEVDAIAHEMDGVAHTLTISGMSLVLGSNSSNFGTMFIVLKPFSERRTPELSADAIMVRLQRECNRRVKDAVVNVLGAPPVPGLSVAGGFKLMVEDRAGLGVGFLQRETDRLVARLQKDHRLAGVATQFRSNTPQLFMDINRTKAKALGVSLTDVNETLQAFLGSQYVANFNAFGRYWQVTLQAEGDYRSRNADVNLLTVRNNTGQRVPLATLVNLREIGGPVMVQRYNLHVTAPITGAIRPDVSSGQAITIADAAVADTLPRSMATEWTELMFIQIRAGDTALDVFLLAVVFVFLALAALYESWTLPLAVILVVPLCLLCSVIGVLLSHTAVNIFVQIGLVVLVGLACKNAILIVEFAKQLREQGKPTHDATLEASRLRLRPILMTSFAFILGVLPLVVATGAGAEMRRSLGTAVFSGMLGVTLFGIFLTPVFFHVIEGLSEGHWLTFLSMRWLVSTALGGFGGLALGYLLARVRVVGFLWGPLGGFCLGVMVSLVALEIHRRMRPQTGSNESRSR